VRQGFWKHTHTLVRARSEEETYKWEDFAHIVRSTSPPRNIVYCSCRLPKKAQEQRELIRQKYSIEGYKHKEYSLQELCLQAHSSKGQTIDTLVLEVTEGTVVHIPRVSIIATEIYRITLEDSRGIPIKARNLEPYNHTELEAFIKEPFFHWVRAGGFERYTQGGPSFWIDLWEITATESPTPLQWLIQEVNPEGEPRRENTQNSGEGAIAMTKEEGEHHQHQLNSGSYHHTIYNQGEQRGRMPVMKLLISR
jgi:hypothetical protein